MNLLKSFIRKVNLIYDKLNLHTKGNIFCILFNLKSFITNKRIRFDFDKKSFKYIATNEKYKRYFYAKRPSFYAYKKGIDNRAEQIGRDYLLHNIEFKEGDTVIDCGANIGDLELYFVLKQIKVNYLAFEPAPAEFECLKLNLILERSRSFNLGLFNKPGSLKFYVSSEEADSSFIKPYKFENIKFVNTERFENIYKKLNLNKIKLLKLEAEGAEPEILLGSKSVLHKIEYIAADVGFERGIEQRSTLPEVNNFLMINQFKLIDNGKRRIVCLYKNQNFNIT